MAPPERPWGAVIVVGTLPLRLEPFQRRFLRAAEGVSTAALSLPRGNGKSWLAARIAADAIPHLSETQEIVVCAASVQQGRIVGRFVREMLGESGWDYRDTAQDFTVRRAVAGHRRGAPVKMRVQGSNGKTAMGLVNVPLVIADEPGAWEANGGALMHDAIQTAQGKPGSPLRAVYIGTLAPALSGWWHDLIAGGSREGIHVTALQGDRKRWEDLRHVYAVNPLSRVSAEFRETLRRERNEAREDSRLRARFLSYRLNVPSADESAVLLSVEDWQRIEARAVPPREGRPIVAYDLAGGRAWSAAVGIWRTGRIEALAVAPGIPSLEDQERRDRVPAGVYRMLAETGALRIAEGLRVQPPGELHRAAVDAWGPAEVILCDRFRLGELQDVVGSTPLSPRVARWSEAGEDIRAVRKLAADGPLSCAEGSRPLLAASLSAAMVVNDDQGNTRLKKKGTNNQARDDVAAALVLAAGAYHRSQRAPRQRWRYRGMAA